MIVCLNLCRSTERTEIYSLVSGTLLVTLPYTTIIVTPRSIVSHTSRALYLWDPKEPDRVREFSFQEFELRATWGNKGEQSGAVYRTKDGSGAIWMKSTTLPKINIPLFKICKYSSISHPEKQRSAQFLTRAPRSAR